jgi:hypothetical protein
MLIYAARKYELYNSGQKQIQYVVKFGVQMDMNLEIISSF